MVSNLQHYGKEKMGDLPDQRHSYSFGRVRRELDAAEGRLLRAGGVDRTVGLDMVRLDPMEDELERGLTERLELEDLDGEPKVDLERDVDRTAGLPVLLVLERELMAGRLVCEEDVRLWL